MNEMYALLMDRGTAFLAGFLIGIGLKTIIDGFARRDDFERRLEGVEVRLDDYVEDFVSHDDRLDGHAERLDDIEEWIDGIEADDEPEASSPGDAGNADGPPFGDYHRFLGKHGLTTE